MRIHIPHCCWFWLLWMMACQPSDGPTRLMPGPVAIAQPDSAFSMPLGKEELHDKVLGMLVGSAIGDAMGAPTEMWLREAIRRDFGFVTGIDTMVRGPSPEGTWAYNLPAGGTTDDTRWKFLFAHYLLREPTVSQLSPENFAAFVVEVYQQEIDALKATDGFDPEPFEDNARRMAWLQEWALVAKPFLAGDIQQYSAALNRFYGGDLACAGMLYAPMIGLAYPGNPEKAYREAYSLGMFDLGYARDLSSLTAAMVAAAMAPAPSPRSVMDVVRDVDPQGFFKSRLIGRTAHRLLTDARQMVADAQNLDSPAALLLPAMPLSGLPADSLKSRQWQFLYAQLDARNQDVPFHAGEIFQVGVTALLFTEMDFEESMAFIINFGRDNDTTGAVFGAVLGAYHGYEKLPTKLAREVVAINRTRLGIDLALLADQLTEKIWAGYGN